jgi:ATP-binding cassette, subfamily B, bacterial
MKPRVKKFFSYYKPYLPLFYTDMLCAVLASAAILAIPLCIRYVTKNLLEIGSPHALKEIYIMGGIMLALEASMQICTTCN